MSKLSFDCATNYQHAETVPVSLLNAQHNYLPAEHERVALVVLMDGGALERQALLVVSVAVYHGGKALRRIATSLKRDRGFRGGGEDPTQVLVWHKAERRRWAGRRGALKSEQSSSSTPVPLFLNKGVVTRGFPLPRCLPQTSRHPRTGKEALLVRIVLHLSSSTADSTLHSSGVTAQVLVYR